MPAISRILVAIKDPRSISRPAVRKAAQIATACHAQLELFHCLTTPLYMDPVYEGQKGLKTTERELRQDALRRLERIAATIRQPGLKITAAADWDYPAYDAIVRRALRIKADLIVASVHAGPHLLPGLLRLTDWELVRLSPVPLLLIKNPRPYHRPAVLVAVDPAHAFAKPLRLDAELLRAGSTISRSLRGSLHAIHAYARLSMGAVPPGAEAITAYAIKRAEQQAKRTAEADLNRALQGTGISRARRYVIGRHPIDAILQACRKSHSALVVMGAVSRSGLRRLLIGNTAESILDEIRCDVLVIKPKRFRNRVPRAVGAPRIAMATPMGLPVYF
jgi:universal stress protein E